MLLLEFAVEALGNSLDIQRCLQATRGVSNGDVALSVELADVHHHRRELAQKEIARLPFDVKVVAGIDLGPLAFHPIPQALRALAIDEDEQILVMEFRNLLGDRRTRLAVGYWPFG